MKATQLLRMHHQDIDQLFDRLEAARDSERNERRDELCATLVAHSVIEREQFYPMCAPTEAFDNEISQALEEHAIVEWTTQRLLAVSTDDPSFAAKVVVLRELFKRHVDEEEDAILPAAERLFDDHELEDVGARMEARYLRARHSWPAELAKMLGVSAASVRTRKPAAARGRVGLGSRTTTKPSGRIAAKTRATSAAKKRKPAPMARKPAAKAAAKKRTPTQTTKSTRTTARASKTPSRHAGAAHRSEGARQGVKRTSRRSSAARRA